MNITVPGLGNFQIDALFSGISAPGNVFFLNDQATLAADADARSAMDPTTPAKTAANAALFAVANHGDVIVIGPNHSQSIATLLSVTEVPGLVWIHTGYGMFWRMRGEGGAANSLDTRDGGFRLVQRAPSNLPAGNANLTIFTITGQVRIIEIFGIVTTAIQNQACNLKITALVTGLTAVDICANGAITNAALGTCFSIDGTLADALIVSANAVRVGQAAPIDINGNGIIRITPSATNTGQVQWYCRYESLAPGSVVVAA